MARALAISPGSGGLREVRRNGAREVPIYSLAISAALEAMRRMPIVLDGDVSDTGQPIALFKHVRT